MAFVGKPPRFPYPPSQVEAASSASLRAFWWWWWWWEEDIPRARLPEPSAQALGYHLEPTLPCAAGTRWYHWLARGERRGGAGRREKDGRRDWPKRSEGRGGEISTCRTQEAVGTGYHRRNCGCQRGTALTAASGLCDEWTVSDRWAGEFGGVQGARTPPPLSPPLPQVLEPGHRVLLAAVRKVPLAASLAHPEPQAQC